MQSKVERAEWLMLLNFWNMNFAACERPLRAARPCVALRYLWIVNRSGYATYTMSDHKRGLYYLAAPDHAEE